MWRQDKPPPGVDRHISPHTGAPCCLQTLRWLQPQAHTAAPDDRTERICCLPSQRHNLFRSLVTLTRPALALDEQPKFGVLGRRRRRRRGAPWRHAGWRQPRQRRLWDRCQARALAIPNVAVGIGGFWWTRRRRTGRSETSFGRQPGSHRPPAAARPCACAVPRSCAVGCREREVDSR